MNNVKIIKGGQYADERGRINYVNEFTFSNVNRFYVITQNETKAVRAWQGHRIEKKYFFVVKGSFLISWVKIDNWEIPSKNLKAEHLILHESDSPVLFIPNGYANGLKAMERDSKLIVFSEFGVSKSTEELKRYDSDLWFDWKNIEPLNL